jgi:hypothetical protein
MIVAWGWNLRKLGAKVAIDDYKRDESRYKPVVELMSSDLNKLGNLERTSLEYTRTLCFLKRSESVLLDILAKAQIRPSEILAHRVMIILCYLELEIR